MSFAASKPRVGWNEPHRGKRARIRGVNIPGDVVDGMLGRGESRPPGFTGRWGSAYFYLGNEWTGPSNAIGARR